MTDPGKPILPREDECVPDWTGVVSSTCLLVGILVIVAVIAIALMGMPVLWTVLLLVGVWLIMFGALLAQEQARVRSANKSGR